jgi:integrase
MKAGKEHRVPLSARALKLLRELHDEKQGDYVFPGRGGDVPLTNMAMLTTLKRMERDDITVHGFRSSFRDWASERTSYPREVCEMALAHAVSDAVEAAYRRGDLFEKRRRLMAEWAKYCAQPATAGDVIPLRAKGGP